MVSGKTRLCCVGGILDWIGVGGAMGSSICSSSSIRPCISRSRERSDSEEFESHTALSFGTRGVMERFFRKEDMGLIDSVRSMGNMSGDDLEEAPTVGSGGSTNDFGLGLRGSASA